jgi:hypothetical protein
MIFDLFKIGASLFTSWNENSTQIKKIKEQSKIELIKTECKVQEAKAISQLKMIEKTNDQNFDLDRETVKNMDKTWKDEYILILITIPIILAFTPIYEYSLRGFEILEKMPPWFITLFILLVVSISGVRGLFKSMGKLNFWSKK